jgi:hypothetical protein
MKDLYDVISSTNSDEARDVVAGPVLQRDATERTGALLTLLAVLIPGLVALTLLLVAEMPNGSHDSQAPNAPRDTQTAPSNVPASNR